MEKYDKALAKNGSVEEIVDMVLELGGEIPYLEISPEKETTRYCEKKNIPVNNIRELRSFYKCLEDKLAEIGNSDEKAKRYFELREYRTQLERLPQELSKLEKSTLKTNSKFDNLKEPFKAVINYVWEAVKNEGFYMNNGEVLVEESMSNNEYFNFRTFARISIDRGSLADLWINYKKKKNKFTIQFYKLLSSQGNFGFRYFPEEIIDLLKEDTELYPEKVERFIEIFFNLPKIMDSYVNKTREKVEEIGNKIDGIYKHSN